MTVKLLDSHQASIFHEASQDGTFFTQPKLLEHTFDYVEWWGYFKGEKILCMWPIILNDRREPLNEYNFTYYIGPVWARDLPNIPVHRSSSLCNSVYTSFVHEFAQKYTEVTSEFNLNLTDMRPFIWINQLNDSEDYSIKIKYTAMLELDTSNNFLENFRQARRRQLKNSVVDNLEFIFDDYETSDIINFYCQNIPPFNQLQTRPKNLIETLSRYLSLKEKFGLKSIRVVEKTSGKTVAFNLVGVYRDVVNVLLNFTCRTYHENGSFLPTYLNTLIIQKFSEMGYKRIDYNGANSPHLADDKNSYGAKHVPFYRLEMKFGARK